MGSDPWFGFDTKMQISRLVYRFGNPGCIGVLRNPYFIVIGLVISCLQPSG
jgi:hypothetical protein